MWRLLDNRQLLCPECGRSIEEHVLNRDDFTRCTVCTTPLRVVLFPAYLDTSDDRDFTAEEALTEEAVCFNHENKRADVACEQCGRFLCSLCELEISDEILCPTCFDQDREEDEGGFERSSMLYGKVALYLAIVPVFCAWPATVVSAPASMFVALYYWNDSGGRVPTIRWRNVVAILLSAGQIFGWVILFIYLLSNA